MSRLLAALLISAAVITPLTANAFGLGLPSIGGQSSTNGSTADLGSAQDQLVKQYVEAGKSVLVGNANIADALGLKDEAATLRATSDNMKEGATKGNLSDADKASSDSAKKIAEVLKNPVQLDVDAKKKYAAGLLAMAQGFAKYIGMKSSFEAFQNSLTSASPMMLPKLQSGAYIVTSLPSNVKNLGSALNNAVAFAKSHDIEFPKDVTAALNSSAF